jgi:hypothetical protein
MTPLPGSSNTTASLDAPLAVKPPATASSPPSANTTSREIGVGRRHTRVATRSVQAVATDGAAVLGPAVDLGATRDGLAIAAVCGEVDASDPHPPIIKQHATSPRNRDAGSAKALSAVSRGWPVTAAPGCAETDTGPWVRIRLFPPILGPVRRQTGRRLSRHEDPGVARCPAPVSQSTQTRH